LRPGITLLSGEADLKQLKTTYPQRVFKTGKLRVSNPFIKPQLPSLTFRSKKKKGKTNLKNKRRGGSKERTAETDPPHGNQGTTLPEPEGSKNPPGIKLQKRRPRDPLGPIGQQASG